MRLSRIGTVTVALVMLCGSAPAAVAVTAAEPGRGEPRSGRPDCVVPLGAAAHGASAVAALGSRLPLAAAAAGMTTAEFAHTLRADPTLWVDECGVAFYAEPINPDAVAATPTGETAPIVTQTADPLALASRPGAARTLHLDFDGATISGTAWNSSWTGGADFTAPAYTADADPAFSAAELDVIRAVWARVAEDYAPFDVNVTTADPGDTAITRSDSSDAVYGTRVVISPTTTGYSSCSCGGIAYVGVFDSTGTSHPYYQPAWVFTKGVGTGAKNIAEAASHEAGHNLGLSHDGTVAHDSVAAAGYYSGQGAWAPIMGVGYYKPVSQWSRGEYAYASNTQDDFVVMAANGAPAVADDHAGSRAGATPVVPGTPVSGVVSSATDQDWFGFNGSGTTTVTVTVADPGADLDVRLGLVDASGVTVATADPAVSMVSSATATGLSATLTASLPAGAYGVRVQGTGYGDALTTGYSAYGSLGSYRLDVATTPVAAPLAVTTTALPSALVGSAYSASLTAGGGTAPYTWAVAPGALPAGLVLSASGALTGTPTTAGTSSFTVVATDTLGATASRDLTLTVAQPAEPLSITTTSLPSGKVKAAYVASLAATGGAGAYSWSLASGKLPPGLSLSAAGSISGKPTKAGTYAMTVRVTSGTATATRSLAITVSR